jgi:three-Cys-motif partner protein
VPKVSYEWDINSPYPPIQQHSVIKHNILREYLIAYIRTLISSPNQERFKLTLVDGFAGGGAYKHASNGSEVLGSPFVMLQSVEEAGFLVNKDRHKPITLDLEYFFIEKEFKAIQHLEYELKNRDYGSQIDKNIFLRHSLFDIEADSIIDHIKKRSPRSAKAIFLLDQYGYSDVPKPIIRKILTTLQGSEIILTFAVDSFSTYATDKDGRTKNLLNKINLPDIFQGRSIEDIKNNESDWRLYIQSSMYKALIDGCGARFYTLFFIRSDRGRGDYWLVHLSQVPRARDVMTEVHWRNNTNFIHYGGPGLDMFTALGYVSTQDENFTNQPSLGGFGFDNDARTRSITALREQIPELIYPQPDGMCFSEMFASTCNMSPASSRIFREAISELIDDKDVLVVGENGSKRYSANTIRNTDQIIAHPNRRFHFL